MSGLSKITERAEANGWMLLGSHRPNTTTFYKWGPCQTRIELHVVCDAAGRIDAVSLWHNKRQSIAHQPGVFAEAEKLLARDPWEAP